MDSNRGKLLSDANGPSFGETLQPNGSHVVALARPLSGLENPKEVNESNLSEYHLTVRVQNDQLGPRQISLILQVLEYQIVRFGCNFPMYLTLVELAMRLSSGRPSHEINDPHVRLTVLIAEVIIKGFKGQDFSLDPKSYLLVSDALKEVINPYLMSKRTYGSRFSSWRPEKFIRIRAVPVSTLYERGSKTSERYSSYTKGYGESHGNAHRVATKPSTELDGDPKVPDREERNLILRVSNPDHQKANSLWIKIQNLLLGK